MSRDKCQFGMASFHRDDRGLETLQTVMIVAVSCLILALLVKAYYGVSSYAFNATDELMQFEGGAGYGDADAFFEGGTSAAAGTESGGGAGGGGEGSGSGSASNGNGGSNSGAGGGGSGGSGSGSATSSSASGGSASGSNSSGGTRASASAGGSGRSRGSSSGGSGGSGGKSSSFGSGTSSDSAGNEPVQTNAHDRDHDNWTLQTVIACAIGIVVLIFYGFRKTR